MMPKFRAYDTKNKVMVTNFHRSHMKIETGKVLYQLNTTNENEIKAIASYNTFDDYIYRYSHDLELMQSTGLKDKKGVEIFEGDVVKVNDDAGYSYITNVYWGGSDNYPAFDLNVEHIPTEWFYESNILSAIASSGESETIEIIGNIYEHNHLLGK